MLLLNHLPLMFSAIVLGAAFALVAKVLYTHKDTKLSLLLLLSGLLIILVPFMLFKVIKKHRTLLLQQVNKNDKLNEKQKKQVKKNISSDGKLFTYVIRFTFYNYREIMNCLITINGGQKKDEMKIVENTEMKRKMNSENESIKDSAESVLMNFLKPLESFVSKRVALNNRIA
ncbi:hypothetical protein [Neobacillus massiliamazoniensis]|uniref:Uncharacterized protein n=1 Tax=Neobacillus massiliamazoniensis TaxID=1499688 RepID=A0A0U1NRF6_9BACI|nr:hypothetical protein [Neobacillus massiliamazoniensis]CRK80322.1 hypothetical protein BN000_00203 [Neobacillus massiliamazoniensis]